MRKAGYHRWWAAWCTCCLLYTSEGFSESQKIARRGGSYAGQVRQDIEKDTGRPVITSQNAAQLNAVVVDMIESVAETEKPDNDENK